MASNNLTELEGGVMGFFVLINPILFVYKQLSKYNNNSNELWSSTSNTAAATMRYGPVLVVQCFK